MTVTCPEGHRSEATDYCDTCGSPIGSAEPVAGTQGPAGSILELDPEPTAAATQTCPFCGALNVADALFCEACGYDFTTGAAPMGAEPMDDVPMDDVPADAEPRDEELTSGQPAADPADEAPSSTEPDARRADAPVQDHAVAADGPAREEDEPDGGPDDEATADDPDDAPRSRPAQAHARPRHTPPSRDLADTWVVEVWIDPDWYAVQQTDEACPSAGVPDVVVVRRNVVLIGRPSGSLAVRPDVDAGSDSAVSRRHAQLTSDGTRWWIEDLGSSNGTFVGVVGEPLPTEGISPGQRVEIDRDDRIYVGAWTRLVVRQATASERTGQG